jgi:molybdopterin synthase catalytic subunit
MTERVVFARVSSVEISVEECVRAVEHSGAGAVVTFAGIVRNRDGGREVVSLEYEAHPSAAQVLERVATAVAEEFDAVTIAVEHRSGTLVVGELALACAVSSAHRSEAFTACARLVDAVKHEVPIWKRQLFVDGTDEWVAAHG